jgi:hypothetical protein
MKRSCPILNTLTFACKNWGKVWDTSIRTWSSSNWMCKLTYLVICEPMSTAIRLIHFRSDALTLELKWEKPQIRSGHLPKFSVSLQVSGLCEINAVWPRTFRMAAQTAPRQGSSASLPPPVPSVSLCSYRDTQWSDLGSVFIPLFPDSTSVGQLNDRPLSRTTCAYDVSRVW